jgi:Uma2 family endonuclease
MEATLEKPKAKPSYKIPASLIYEEMDGKPYYRKGFKEVLLGVKSIEEIMGSSKLQSYIILFIAKYLNKLLSKQFDALTSEAGLNIELGSNLATDIAIYDINKVGDIFETKYFNTAPEIVFEVDVKIDLKKSKDTEMDYISRKTKKLLRFGVKKVFWILTSSQTIIIAEGNQSEWKMTDFSGILNPMEDISFSIKQLVEERGFILPEIAD